jgi:hypothetical protein
MNQFLFVDAAHPKQIRILRLPMEKYSIGHEILLRSERNALAVLSSAEFDALPLNDRISAIMRAVLICSRPYAQYARRQHWLRTWNFLLSRDEFLAAVEPFRQYRKEGSASPPMPTPEEDAIANGGLEKGRMLGGDLMPALLCFMADKCEKLGYETVYEMPYGLALQMYFVELEKEGRIKIQNDRERQVREEMAQAMKEIAEERKAEK